MIRKIILLFLVGVNFAGAFAQSDQSSPFERLASSCRDVIRLNDKINELQSTLDDINLQNDELRREWERVCREALSKPDCDIDYLISQTDPEFESELLVILNNYKDNPDRPVPAPVLGNSGTDRKSASKRRNESDKNGSRSDVSNSRESNEGTSERSVNDNYDERSSMTDDELGREKRTFEIINSKDKNED